MLTSVLAREAVGPTEEHALSSAPLRQVRTLQIGMRWLGSGSGGLDRVFFDLVNALPDVGIAVRGLVLEPADVASCTEGRVSAFASANTNLVQRLIGARREIAALTGTGEFDLVAAHFALHIATALDRLHGLPLIMHFHGPWADESNCEGQNRAAVFAKYRIERLVYGRADRVVVLSKAFAELLIAKYGVAEARVRIVPGSVDLARFDRTVPRSEARLALGWPTDRPILLAVRRLTPRMGLDRLIAAIAQVARVEPDVLLCIAGRGPIEARLRRQVSEMGLERHVRFLGFIPDAELPLAYRAADINVVPTTMLEGFGLIAAEALAAGTPSMVTPVGGLPEVVADLSPDLVFRANSMKGISSGLSAALRGELRLPDAEACRSFAVSRFGTGLAAARTAAVYRELVG